MPRRHPVVSGVRRGEADSAASDRGRRRLGAGGGAGGPDRVWWRRLGGLAYRNDFRHGL